MGRQKEKTGAYKVLEITLDRAEAFLRIFGDGRSVGKPSADDVELLRGAVVFAVGALDAFLRDVVVEIVPAFAPATPALGDALTKIAKDKPGLALEVAFASAKSPSAAQACFGKALDDYLSTQSFQGAAAVIRALGYLGIEIGDGKLDGFVDRRGFAKDLARYTTMRHGMVHRGETPKLKRDEVKACIDLVRTIGTRVNQEVVTRFYRAAKD